MEQLVLQYQQKPLSRLEVTTAWKQLRSETECLRHHQHHHQHHHHECLQPHRRLLQASFLHPPHPLIEDHHLPPITPPPARSCQKYNLQTNQQQTPPQFQSLGTPTPPQPPLHSQTPKGHPLPQVDLVLAQVLLLLLDLLLLLHHCHRPTPLHLKTNPPYLSPTSPTAPKIQRSLKGQL